MITSSEPSIFPQAWLSRRINAESESLHKSEVQRSRKILKKAVSKYPDRVLDSNLKVIYVLHKLKYCGINASGTNSKSNVYVVNRGSHQGYTDSWIEGTFHAEFSSILLRNSPQHLDKLAWKKQNLQPFKYGMSGVQAVKLGKSRQELDRSFHVKGFLHQYATSTVENDFNSIAEQLFLGNPRLWTAARKHQRINNKMMLVIAFYHKIDPRFSKSFFVNLAR